MIPRRTGDSEMNPMPDIDQPEQRRTLCWEFSSTGRCPRGSRCRFLHRPRTSAPPPPVRPPTSTLEENTVSSPSLVPGTPSYCDAFPLLQRTTSGSTRRSRRFHPASPPRASSPSSVHRDQRDSPPPSPPKTPCSSQRDDTLAAGTSTLTALIATARLTEETTPGAAEPTANIIPAATTATAATGNTGADSSPHDNGIEITRPGLSSKPPSRDRSPPPTTPPQTPHSSQKDDTVANGSSNPTTPVTTARITGETTPASTDPTANIASAAAATTTATADTRAALNDGIETMLPGSSRDKPPSRVRNPPPTSPQQTPHSSQKDDTVANGSSNPTAPVTTARITGETAPASTDPTANITSAATASTTAATADTRAALNDGIETMLPGSSRDEPPSRGRNPPPRSPPQTPHSSRKDDTVANISSNPTIPVTTARITGETSPASTDPTANITSAAAATTTAATADTRAALNDGIETMLPGSSRDKPPSRGRNPAPPSPPHTVCSSPRDDTVAADPSNRVTNTGETTPTTAAPTANTITPTLIIITAATDDTRADYSAVDHRMPGWSNNKPPSRDRNPPAPSGPQTPRPSQRDNTLLARTSNPITPVATVRPTGKTTPAATATTTAKAGTRTDYSPLDDGIEITLPGWSSNKPPSREEVNAYIERFLYGPRRPRRKRLPVFEAICPSTPDNDGE